MADLLDDFKTYFIAQNLTTAQACFMDTMLDDPDDAVGIYEYLGNRPVPQVTGVSRSVQVVARSKDPTSAKVKADALSRALETEDGILQLTPERWGMVALRNTPIKIRVDGAGRTYYGFNVGVTTYND